MKRLTAVITFALALALCAFGQSSVPVAAPLQAPIAAAPAAATFLQQITDPSAIAMGAYIFSQVAQGSTNYRVSIGGRSYGFSGAQATAVTAGSVVGLAAMIHKWPKMKTGITIGLGIASTMLGARAYYNSLNHGAPATSPAVATAAVAQIRLR